MPTSLRAERAQTIMKFLTDKYPKAYTIDQLAAETKIPRIGVSRSMPLLTSSNAVRIDKTRSPWMYQYNKGAKINIYPPVELKPVEDSQMNIHTPCFNLHEATKDWKTPPIRKGTAITYAAIYGMGLDDPENREEYIEWLEQASKKLYDYYRAYRLIETIRSMSIKERKLERWGIEPRKNRGDDADFPRMFLEASRTILDGL
jgi:hypothetical protein